jgi:hypothetical protein
MSFSFSRPFAAAALCCAFAGCTNGQVGTYPMASINPTTDTKLQFAVGVATHVVEPGEGLPAQLRHDLNMVETLRSPDGTSGVLNDTPAVTGPANFVAGSPNNGYDGAGPSQIFKSLQGEPALGYGFGALIAGNGGPVQTLLAQVVGGPPAWPGIISSGYPSSFAGFGLGFVDFPPASKQSTSFPNPVRVGEYALTVAFTTDPSTLGNFPVEPPPAGLSLTSQATLTNLKGLPAISQGPSFTPDGVGGGTFSLAIPAGVTETILLVQTANQCYTANDASLNGPGVTVFAVVSTTAGPGSRNFVLPANLGPALPSGNGHTLCTSADNAAVGVLSGTNISGEVIEADYPLFEASYPLDRSQTPKLVGTAGQADVSFASFDAGNYP